MSEKNTFWIGFGDVHNNTTKAARIPNLAQAQGVIISGDISNHGDVPTVKKVLDPIEALNPNIYAQIGNMDCACADAYLSEQGWNIHARTKLLHREQGLPDVGLMGVGYSTPTPFGTPSEVSEEQIKDWLSSTYEQAKDFELLLLVVHTPPYGTGTDKLSTGTHIGSPAVLEFIKTVQPAVCLTGHIHESVAEERVGRTKLINPGMLSAGGYARIERVGNDLDATLMQL